MDEKVEEVSEQPNEFPGNAKHYQILSAIGTSEGATMYKAKYLRISSEKSDSEEAAMVGIKVVDTYRVKDIFNFTREVRWARQLRHENLLQVHCSFKERNRLWVVMPLMPRSLKSIMSSIFPRGLPEPVIAFVLKETLMALDCIHGHEGVHENVDADHVFVDENSTVKLAFDALTHKPAVSPPPSTSMSSNPNWNVQGSKGDIWLFGLLALELFYGRLPISNPNDLDNLVKRVIYGFGPLSKRESKAKVVPSFVRKMVGGCFSTANSSRRSVNDSGDVSVKEMSRSFGEMVVMCLLRYPSRRQTASGLMDHEFFRTGAAADHPLVKEVLAQLRSRDAVEEREDNQGRFHGGQVEKEGETNML